MTEKMILAVSSWCIGLGWGDFAACNNFLIIVNAMSYYVCSNFMLYNASSWQYKKIKKVTFTATLFVFELDILFKIRRYLYGSMNKLAD